MKRNRKRTIDERTSGRDDHCTPLWFMKRVAAFGCRAATPIRLTRRPIGLDPAGAEMMAPCNRYTIRRYRRSRGENGLALSWTRFGLVFCNPPYGTEVRLWAQKAVDEFGFGGAADRSIDRQRDELLMLTAARVDTRWFKLMWQHSTAVLFFHKRFTFVGETDPAKFPQALLYFGRDGERFRKTFGDLGLVIVTRVPLSRADLLDRNAFIHFPGIMSVRIAKRKVPSWQTSPTSSESAIINSSTARHVSSAAGHRRRKTSPRSLRVRRKRVTSGR